MTSAPAPSAFALPRPRSHFPRPRSHFPRIAFHFPRGAIGLPQQQLSTMGYPRKSYPHRCPPPCAKRSRPRACARVYIIYRSPVARSRGVSAPLRKRVRAVVAPCPAPPCAGWGRAKAKADAPSRSAEHAACVPNHCVQRRSAPGKPRPCPCALPAATCLRPRPRPLVCRITVCKGGSAQGNPRSCPCVLPATACLRPCLRPLMGEVPCVLPASARLRPRPRPLMGEVPCVLPAAACLPPRTLPADGRSAERRVGEGEGKGGRPLAQQPVPSRSAPHFPRLPPRPRRLNGHPASAGGRENDRMAHRRTATPRHRTPRGNDTCTIRVPRHKGAQSVVHNLYFSSSRPASFCTTFPQSCTDRPATYRKEHKWPPEGLIFRVLPPAFPPFPPKAIVQNTPAPPPFSPRKTPRFAPTRNRARTLASAGRDNTPRPAHSSRFQ